MSSGTSSTGALLPEEKSSHENPTEPGMKYSRVLKVLKLDEGAEGSGTSSHDGKYKVSIDAWRNNLKFPTVKVFHIKSELKPMEIRRQLAAKKIITKLCFDDLDKFTEYIRENYEVEKECDN